MVFPRESNTITAITDRKNDKTFTTRSLGEKGGKMYTHVWWQSDILQANEQTLESVDIRHQKYFVSDSVNDWKKESELPCTK